MLLFYISISNKLEGFTLFFLPIVVLCSKTGCNCTNMDDTVKVNKYLPLL